MASTVRNNVATTGEDNRYKELHSQKGEINPGARSSEDALARAKINNDAHLNNVLGKFDKVKTDGGDKDPRAAQAQLKQGRLAGDPSKSESAKAAQEQYQASKDMASGLSRLAHNGVPRTDAKPGAGGHDAQTAFQQGQKGAGADNLKAPANPNQQNTAAMAKGVNTGRPTADPGLKQPIPNNTGRPVQVELKEGAKVAQQGAVGQSSKAEQAKAGLKGDQGGGQQAVNLQAGQAGAAGAGVEKIKQQTSHIDDNVEEPERAEDGEKAEDTPESNHTQMAGQAKRFRDMAMAGGMGGGGGGTAEGGEHGPVIEIAANRIGEVHDDQVTYLEMTGESLGFRVISPTVDELQATEAKLTAVRFDQSVLKPLKERITLEEVIRYNQPNQELVKLIIADTKDVIEEARKLLNTGRVNPYGMMSA